MKPSNTPTESATQRDINAWVKYLEGHIPENANVARGMLRELQQLAFAGLDTRSEKPRRLPQEIRDFIEERVDIRDGSDGPRPNDWMTLMQMIEEAGLG